MTDETTEPNGNGRNASALAAIILAVLAAILVSLAVDTVWMHQRIFDTDSFVETLAPLPQEPEVSAAIATRAVEALSQTDGIEIRVTEALPDRLGFLAPRFVGFVDEVVYDTAILVVESDAFTAVWTRSLHAMHTAAIGILDGDVATTESGGVGIDLDAAAGLILDRLEARGVDLFTDIETSFGEVVFIQAETLAAPRAVIDVFHTAVWVFPLAALIVLGIAVAIDRDRLRPVQWFGFGSAVAILISLATVRGLANLAGRSLDDDVGRAAAGVVWDALLNGYVFISSIVGIVTLAVGLGALTWRRIRRTPAS